MTQLSVSPFFYSESTFIEDFSKKTALAINIICGRCKNHLPLRIRETGRFLGFPESQSMPLTELRNEMHLSASYFFFFLNQRSLLVDCFFLKKPTFPSQTATSLEWQAMKSNVTLKCSLLRHFSLPMFFQVLYENLCTIWHFVSLHLRDNLSLVKRTLLSKGALALFAPSEPMNRPPGKLILHWH